jgi:predicted Zn-dependent peptidase
VLLLLLGVVLAEAASAQSQVGREAAEALRVDPISFSPPVPEVREVAGVPVLYLEDHTVPLVTLFSRFRGGYGLFDRSLYGAATALPSLIRYGGTDTLPPAAVDELLEYYAIQTTFGGGGETVFSSLNTLTEHLGAALELWSGMLRTPRFDSAEVEVWRGRQLESVRRRSDDPQRLAFSEFNRLLYGDHPVGWEMYEGDLEAEDLTPEVLREVHGKVLCPENLTLGVTGDVSWDELEPLLESFLGAWPPCAEALPPSPIPDIRREAGVFLIPRELEQSVLVMAHPTAVRLGSGGEYFSAQIGNSILGSGGFGSRILSRVRTEEGYAYSASSLWTMPRHYDGIVGAVTRTRPENTVPALQLILDIMFEMTEAPPTRQEVSTTVDQIVNGFVFNFETPAQIVSRRMFYLAQDLPEDWLEQYLEGIRNVTPESIRTVFQNHVRPEAMTILVVGDPSRIGLEALERLGPITFLDIDGGVIRR